MQLRDGKLARFSETPPGAAEEEFVADESLIRKNRNGVYRKTCLTVWVVVSAAMIVDRFYWNAWPRQTICSPGCGDDFFCSMDEDPWCLKKGPWSVKVFDVIARISARLIISTTSLMFITMCHGTFNALSEVRFLEPFLYSWRQDNVWLHEVGGWVMGFWTVLHVWSLFLPSVFHGFKNVVIGGGWDYPLQVSLPASQINSTQKQAAWGYDDIWRVFWITVIFIVLIPLSRSVWALKGNFTLAMWLHMLAGLGMFFDSWRRKSHPHVWILNTPVFLWWLVDKIVCAAYYRVNPCAETIRIVLDGDYILLLWKDDSQPKRICDLYWIKRGYDPSNPKRSGRHVRFTGELPHAFTTCSSHDVAVAAERRGSRTDGPSVVPAIEPPIKTDVHWEGHRFTLMKMISGRLSLKNLFSGSQADADQEARMSAMNARNGRQGTKRDFSTDRGSARDVGVTWSRQGTSDLRGSVEDWKTEEGGAGTMIGVDVRGDSAEDLTVVYGDFKSIAVGARGLSTVPEMEEVSFADGNMEETEENLKQYGDAHVDESMEEGHVGSMTERVERSDSEGHRASRTNTEETDTSTESGPRTPNPGLKSSLSQTQGAFDDPTKSVLMRMPTTKFLEHRQREREQGKGGPLPGSWSKMAIVRVHRRSHEAMECSCLGVTHALAFFRQPETGNIADLEASSELRSIPLRTQGPYRSEYGRLCEFPNLPPLLIVATGAGAALVLDFVAYIRARKLPPARRVKVVYSTASLPLLQFVTDSLLAEHIPGVEIRTALTRHDDLQYRTMSGAEQELAMGRIDVESIIASVSVDTEVYFCGGGGLNALLRKQCASRCLRYIGSAVQ